MAENFLGKKTLNPQIPTIEWTLIFWAKNGQPFRPLLSTKLANRMTPQEHVKKMDKIKWLQDFWGKNPRPPNSNHRMASKFFSAKTGSISPCFAKTKLKNQNAARSEEKREHFDPRKKKILAGAPVLVGAIVG